MTWMRTFFSAWKRALLLEPLVYHKSFRSHSHHLKKEHTRLIKYALLKSIF